MENPFDSESVYDALDILFERLFPVPRSITGPGLRESLRIMQDAVPLEMESVPSGTDVFDWTVPPEWRIHEAYLEGPDGVRYADFEESNLQVVNYSEPVDRRIALSELKPHLYTDPDTPDAVPYVTSYYDRKWGFCLAHETYESLPDGEYHAYIDSEFVDGELSYGHTTIDGRTDREILLTSYLCHPSLANNELSGPLVLAALYNQLIEWNDPYYTYRFVVAPETIGSLCYLSEYGDHLQSRLTTGAVLTCLGGPSRRLSYKLSRSGHSLFDKVVRNQRDHGDVAIETRPFTPVGGSDERQYCSPGFDLPVGQFARSVYGEYEGYHTSKDDKELMGIEPLLESTNQLESLLRGTERAGAHRNTEPYGEPMLSQYDLYPSTNAPETWNDSTDTIVDDERKLLDAILRILNYSDGEHDMIDIATDHGYSIMDLLSAIQRLERNGLLRRVAAEGSE